jgi:predicted esterase
MSRVRTSLWKVSAYFWIVCFSLLVIGCGERNDPTPQSNQYLISAQPAGELSQQEVINIARQVNPLLGGVVQSGVKLYKITYKTVNVDGSEITASGAVALPTGAGEYSMLSVQHGTITNDSDAPSNLTPGNDFMRYGSLFGALGYIAVFPDYIGYGASKHLPHPYEHRESLGRASLDMLRAVKEWAATGEDVKWNKKLYISGFSEGGYATLSLQKMLEEDAKGEFDLKASTCGAGAYDKSAFMKYLVNNETHGNAGYNRSYLWVLLSYNWIYNINLPMSHFFVPPYDALIERDKHMATIQESFHRILQPSFVKGVNEGTEQKFLAAVADNDLTGWKPVTPTQLYHGTSDQLVFYFNSENAYESMKAKGATQVELITLKDKDHSTAVLEYLMGTYSFFNSKL